jgi:monoamine oxidase
VIVGAGASGLSAGNIFSKNKVDYLILEAGESFGGRLKENREFADFPIDLGAEWIHQGPSILEEIALDKNLDISENIIFYNPKEILGYEDGELVDYSDSLAEDLEEYKFKDTTWFEFFKEYVYPKSKDKIKYNSFVHEVNYSGETVEIKYFDKEKNKEASIFSKNVLLTVPVSVLSSGKIKFKPTLDNNKKKAIKNTKMGFCL